MSTSAIKAIAWIRNQVANRLEELREYLLPSTKEQVAEGGVDVRDLWRFLRTAVSVAVSAVFASDEKPAAHPVDQRARRLPTTRRGERRLLKQIRRAEARRYQAWLESHDMLNGVSAIR